MGFFSPQSDEANHRTCLKGLYYKLHGVHRPVTMKKAIIKRRKRVIPVSQNGEEIEIDHTTTTPPPFDCVPNTIFAPASASTPAPAPRLGSTSSDGPSLPPISASTSMVQPTQVPEKGTMNPDGSINLGLRSRPSPGPLTLLPDPQLAANQRHSPPLAGRSHNLSNYYSNSNYEPSILSDLNAENRLAPIKSLPGLRERQSSTSPASVLGVGRKRSFSSAAEPEPLPELHDKPKRQVNSIKSILNPCNDDGESPASISHPRSGSPMSTTLGSDQPSPQTSQQAPGYSPSLMPSQRQSPHLTYDNLGRSPVSTSATLASVPSPGAFSNTSSGPEERGDRRALLRKEAENLRVLLKEAEAELAALD